jgi:hypothetical protein
MFLSTTNIRLVFKNLENRCVRNYIHTESEQEFRTSQRYQENESVGESDGLPNLFFDNLPELEVIADIINPPMTPSLFVLLAWNHLQFEDPSQIQLFNLEYSVRKPPSRLNS